MDTKPGAAALISVGAVAGLAWACALRGWMVQLAGTATTFEWLGTFTAVLLPGVIIGALLGWAEHLRRTGGPKGWRWLAAAPALFPIAALAMPGALVLFLTTGVGGGAVAVALTAVLGGYAISGRGPLWARIVTGVIAVAGLIAGAGVSGAIQPDLLALDTPRGVWGALTNASLTVLFALAASIPHRPTRKD